MPKLQRFLARWWTNGCLVLWLFGGITMNIDNIVCVTHRYISQTGTTPCPQCECEEAREEEERLRMCWTLSENRFNEVSTTSFACSLNAFIFCISSSRCPIFKNSPIGIFLSLSIVFSIEHKKLYLLNLYSLSLLVSTFLLLLWVLLLLLFVLIRVVLLSHSLYEEEA